MKKTLLCFLLLLSSPPIRAMLPNLPPSISKQFTPTLKLTKVSKYIELRVPVYKDLEDIFENSPKKNIFCNTVLNFLTKIKKLSPEQSKKVTQFLMDNKEKFFHKKWYILI